MKGMITGAIASLIAAGAWAEVRVVETEFEFDGHDSGFDIVLENTGDKAVSAIEYLIVYLTPGRATPWAEQPLRMQIPGGIEPGEQRQVGGFAPAVLSESEGHEVAVEVRHLVGLDPDGNPIE